MRFLLTFFLSLQFISGPVAADLGERKNFSAKDHLLTTVSSAEGKEFEDTLRAQIESARKKGLVVQNQKVNPIFKEVSKGVWHYSAKGDLISFTTADIYKKQLYINGKVLKYENLTPAQIEEKAQELLKTKTTLLDVIYRNTFGIQNAEACELVCAVVVVVLAIAAIGSAVFSFMVKPEKVVKRLNEMKDKLEKDAIACEGAKSDSNSYSETFHLAMNIADRSSLSSLGGPSEAIELALKEQFASGTRKNEDCYKIMNEIGKKIDIDIPIPTDRQIQMRELGGHSMMNEKMDVQNAAFNLCSSYNRLGSCMSNFVAAHVNSSDLSIFKDSAEHNEYRYKRNASSTRQ